MKLVFACATSKAIADKVISGMVASRVLNTEIDRLWEEDYKNPRIQELREEARTLPQTPEECEGPCYNPNQSVRIEGNKVVIEGERHALWSDAWSPVMKGLKEAGCIPSQYNTSDARLEWFEVLENFMEARASIEEILESEYSNKARALAHWLERSGFTFAVTKEWLAAPFDYRKMGAAYEKAEVKALEMWHSHYNKDKAEMAYDDGLIDRVYCMVK